MWSVLEFYARFLALTPLSRMVHRGHSVNELISARFVAPAERRERERERIRGRPKRQVCVCECGCVCAFDTWLPKTKQEKKPKPKSVFIEVIVAHFWVNCVCPAPRSPLLQPSHSVAACLIIYVALIEFCSPQKGQLKLLKKHNEKFR